MASGSSQKSSVGPSGLVMGKRPFLWKQVANVSVKEAFLKYHKKRDLLALKNPPCVQHVIIQTTISQIMAYLRKALS